MDYALALPFGGAQVVDPEWLGDIALHAESCGFESLVVAEHSVMISGTSSAYPYSDSGRLAVAVDSPLPDPLELLGFLAARTRTIGLATGALILPNHHPVVLAKRAATVDVLSGGRLRLCVGVGWLREEIEACGVDFATRGRRADEQLEVLRKLWAPSGPGGVDHEGAFFRFRSVLSHPKPVRPEGVPLHIGGHSAAAARRAGRYGDGFQPLGVTGAELKRLTGIVRAAAERHGRDPDSVQLTLSCALLDLAEEGLSAGRARERARALADQGADRVVLQTGGVSDAGRLKDLMSRCAERLALPAARAA